MNYSYAGCKEKGFKRTLYFREEKEKRGHEVIEVSVKVSGKRAMEIMEMSEKAVDELEINIKAMLEKRDSEESQNEKELADMIVNEWCQSYQENFQAYRDSHGESE